MDHSRVNGLTVFLALSLALFGPVRLHAHPPAPPVRGVLQLGDAADDPRRVVYGGYGYIAESEAEAHEALKLECRLEDMQEDYREFCGVGSSPRYPGQSLVDDVMSGVILSDLRRHEAEFRIMQLKALGAPDIELPECLESDSDIKSLFARLPGRVPHWTSLENLPAAERELLNRHRIATSPLRSEEMIRALIYSDHLQAVQLKLCSGSRLSDALGSQCVSIENNLSRLEASFPGLLETRGEEERRVIREGMHLLLSADLEQGYSETERARIGEARYESALETANALAANSMEIKIADALFESEQGETPEPRRSNLRGARDRINSGLAGLFKKEIEHHEQALEELCEQDSLNTYIAKQPQVVRQTLMDADPRTRALMRLVLCESPLSSGLARRSTCDKVTLTPSTSTAPARVTVNRREWNYPYGSNINYQIEVPPAVPANQPYVISTQLKIRADSNLSEEQIAAKVGSMQEQLSGFFGCMSGERAEITGIPGLEDRKPCPPDPRMSRPPVRFKISVERTPPAPETPPVVGLHGCYRAELPISESGNCEKIREFVIKQCVESIELWQKAGKIGGSSRYALPMEEFLTSIAVEPLKLPLAAPSASASPSPDFLKMTATEIRGYCETRNPPATDGRYDRENAGNYTLNSHVGTVIHEMAHALGLPDEYQDPSYPFLPQGEHDSIMNASKLPQASFKVRHIKRFLEPLSCFQGLIEAGRR